jgi:thioredoxin 1
MGATHPIADKYCLQPLVYADWCGPCKMIAPTFESLSTKYSKPGKITFAKVNVDNQQDVAQQYGVRAMPTFLVLHNGSVISTIQGANPPALTAAVEKAVKLAGAGGGPSFGTAGQRLGGTGVAGVGGRTTSVARPIAWDLNNFINALIMFIGLYFVSLFSVSAIEPRAVSPAFFRWCVLGSDLRHGQRADYSWWNKQFDPYKAAENSQFNKKSPPPVAQPAGARGAPGQPGRAAPKSSFKTLSDLGN